MDQLGLMIHKAFITILYLYWEFEPTHEKGNEVSLFVDEHRRKLNSRPWVEYKGTVPQNELQSKQRDLELEANALVSLGERISVDILPYDEAAKICGGSLPDYISKVSQNRSKKRLTKVSYKVES
ncbi:uncharacterized protein LOC114175569 [Vigna unguiculata]|uniref:uncharacterized protein LOC114175569 n=1 Tax=Vigna unguiculata TaxID=3917 RepID=UPI001015E2C9|nr:uncharacterized protein LOC114175569 [Vigna unguiculata]